MMKESKTPANFFMGWFKSSQNRRNLDWFASFLSGPQEWGSQQCFPRRSKYSTIADDRKYDEHNNQTAAGLNLVFLPFAEDLRGTDKVPF